MLRLQTAAFGIGKALGAELEGGEIDEDVACACEALLEPGGERPNERGALRVGPNDRERFGQQPRPFRIRGSDPPG